MNAATDHAAAARCLRAAKDSIRRALDYRAQLRGRVKPGHGGRRGCRALDRNATADAVGRLAAAIMYRDGAHRDAMFRVEAISADANAAACAAAERLTTD